MTIDNQIILDFLRAGKLGPVRKDMDRNDINSVLGVPEHSEISKGRVTDYHNKFTVSYFNNALEMIVIETRNIEFRILANNIVLEDLEFTNTSSLSDVIAICNDHGIKFRIDNVHTLLDQITIQAENGASILYVPTENIVDRIFMNFD
jgi:hypothetical protein